MKIQLTIGDNGISLKEAQDVLYKLAGNASFGVVVADQIERSLDVATQNHEAKNSTFDDVSFAGMDKSLTLTPSVAVDGEVDAEGLPWDERIHSSNKKKTAKNVWVARRNVDDAAHAAVVAELKGRATVLSEQWAHLGSPLPNIAPAEAFDGIPSFTNVPTIITPPPAPVVPTIITPPPAPVVPVAATQPKTFNDIILRLQGLFQLGTADGAYVAGLQNRIGSQFGITVASINDIQSRPDCIQWTLDTITADGK